MRTEEVKGTMQESKVHKIKVFKENELGLIIELRDAYILQLFFFYIEIENLKNKNPKQNRD